MAQLEKDLTKGNVWKQLIVFAVPFFISNLIQSVYSVVDMLIVSRYGGTNSVSGVSISSMVMLIVTNLAAGIATGGTVMIGQFLGAGEREKIKESISTLFITLAALAVILTGTLFVFINPLLEVLNTPPEAYKDAYGYLLVSILGITFIFGYNALGAVMRGMGDGKTPLKFITVACIINIILDMVFVKELHMGATGAAIATVIAQALSMISCVIYLVKNQFIFDFRLASFRFSGEKFVMLMKVGLPSAVQQVATNFSFLVLGAQINSIAGVAASAATGIISKFHGFALLPESAISMSVAAMVSQNMGVGDLKRTRKVTGYGLILCYGISLMIFAFVRIFPQEIFRLFGAEEDVVSVGLIYMKAFSFEYVGMPFIVALNGVFIGTGNGWVSLVTDTTTSFLVRIPLAIYLGATVGLGIFGIGCAVPCATFVGAFITFLFYLSGCWKKSTIIGQPQVN